MDQKKPKVVHCKVAQTAFVYIGRGSKWGNPFSSKEGTKALWTVSTRQEAIESYARWIETQPHLLASLGELRGRDLGCYCAPKDCHGDVLLRLANAEPASD